MKMYAAFGIEMVVEGQVVGVSVGRHVAGSYVADRTYTCKVSPGHRWLTPWSVADALRSALTMSIARNTPFYPRRALDEIALGKLAIPADIALIQVRIAHPAPGNAIDDQM